MQYGSTRKNWLINHYPFGSIVESRSWKGDYRYGFNGQEGDDEVSGAGNSYTAEYWQYDSRLGRRWNVDPKSKTYESPFIAFSNCPILFMDPLGDTSIFYSNSGEKLGQVNDNLPAAFISVDDEFASTLKDEILNLNDSELGEDQLDNAARYLRMQGIQYSLQDYSGFFDEHQELHDNSDWEPYDNKGPLINEYAVGFDVDQRGKVVKVTDPVQGNPNIVVPLPNTRIRLHTHPNPDRRLKNVHTKQIRELETTSARSLGVDKGNTFNTSGSGVYDIVVDPINIYLFNDEKVITINRKTFSNISKAYIE